MDRWSTALPSPRTSGTKTTTRSPTCSKCWCEGFDGRSTTIFRTSSSKPFAGPDIALAIEASSSSQPGIQRLVRLRLRLTIWYVATFGLIVLLLGAGLFVVISHQLSQQLDDSLKSATLELIRAARIRDMEAAAPRTRVLDAVDELNIPDRMLYLLDMRGNPVKPAKVDDWIRRAAKEAARTG